MELVRGWHNLGSRHRGCALTIGSYDGLHRGHQAVLQRLRREAAARGLPSALLTFEPLPREFFDPGGAPPRLASLREKAEDIAAQGLDRLVCLRFDRALAALSPEAFIEDLLVARLEVGYILVGRDFRFGHRRGGDVELLADYGGRFGFEVEAMPTVRESSERISSSRVRQALADGDPETAGRLLGRPYRMSGRVCGGARLGRRLGVPTANLQVTRKPAPRFGVYAVEAELEDGRRLPGAANLGIRPVIGGDDCLLEVHLLDFTGDLYGRRLNVHFRHYLRPEAHFENTEALRVQMLDDIEQVRSLLAAPCNLPNRTNHVPIR